MVLTDPTMLLTTADAARYFGVPTWMVRRLFEAGRLPPAQRFGGRRVIRPADLPTVEKALRAAGYLAGDAEPQGRKRVRPRLLPVRRAVEELRRNGQLREPGR
jgi:hypothetical protein